MRQHTLAYLRGLEAALSGRGVHEPPYGDSAPNADAQWRRGWESLKWADGSDTLDAVQAEILMRRLQASVAWTAER